MKRNNIYLDTSILNFFFEKRDMEKENSTKDLFREINQGKFKAHISELVLRECSCCQKNIIVTAD